MSFIFELTTVVVRCLLFSVPWGDHQEHPRGGEGIQLAPPCSYRPGHQGPRDQDRAPGGGRKHLCVTPWWLYVTDGKASLNS